MAENKKGFVLYADIIHTVNQLPNEDAGKLLKHILSYVNDLKPETDSLIVKIAFEPIKQQLKRDLIKYESKIEQRSAAGQASAAKRAAKKNEKQRESTTVGSRSTDSTVTVKDTDTDTDKDISINRKHLENQLINSFTWIESVVKNFKALKLQTTPEKILIAVEIFCNKLEVEEDVYKTLRETKSHFSRWYKIELEKEIKTTTKKSRNERNLDHNTQTANELGLDQ